MRRPLLYVCIILFVCIAAWMQITSPPPFEADHTGWEGETVIVTGRVYQKEYRIRYGEEILVLYLDSIMYSDEPNAVHSKQTQFSKKLSDINSFSKIICEIKVNELSEGDSVPRLGSKVILQGTWKGYSHATNPGEFDAANYYAILGISACVRDAKLHAVGEHFWYLRETLYLCKERWLRNIYCSLPQKDASILAKMLLGDGSGLDEEIRDLYQSNGIVHILSISGLHITMLGMGLYRLLRKGACPIAPAAVGGAIIILLYGTMTGFGVSACRAIGMYLIHMIGELWGRCYDMLTAMGILAVLMLFRNPYLVYHSGYLLSFFSVCAVGMVAPALAFPGEWFRRCPGESKQLTMLKKYLQKLCSGLSVSAGVTLFTLPLQFYFFYKIPVYSVIINLFVIPFMSAVMVIGILLMLSPVFGFLGSVEVFIFGWFEWLCRMFERLPGHTWAVGKPDMWQVLCYYVLFVVILAVRKYMHKYVFPIGIAALVCLLGMRWEQGLTITVLDVGQGDCICVQTAGGKCFLFDGGSSSRANVGEKVIVPFLQHQGVDCVDAVFLSHGDEDHCNGVAQMMSEDLIQIKALYLPDVGENARRDFSEILDSAKDTKIQFVAMKDRWEMPEADIICMHPKRGFEADSNAYSACYLLCQDEFSMLFTGDVEREGEQALKQTMQELGVDEVDILKVAHHGSKYSTSEEFLEAVHVRMAFISCGRNNRYGHPHAETLDRLTKEHSVIMSTTEYGAITVKVGKRIRVRGFCEKKGEE